jgi:Cof subfamily protein (haloacid dehalogenase superfamily)
VRLPFRLLAIDIDGTLLNSQFKISTADMEALRQVHASGAEIILCTGRRHQFAMPIAQLLGFDIWMCSSNGAVTRSSRGEPFHRDLLPAEVALALCQHMLEFRSGTVLTFDREDKGAIVVERTDELAHNVRRWIEKNEQYIERIVPIERALTRDPIQAMVCGTVKRMRAAESLLRTFPGFHQITMLKTQYDHRDLCLLDVLNRDCSKGHAVERWASHRGIAREEIMAIGDNFNDIEMLEYAGIPVLMGNASDDLKSRGWMQTRSNDESGVAAAIEAVMNRSEITTVVRHE